LKKASSKVEETSVSQAAITYIAAIAAGFPYSTSSDYDAIHTALNGVLNKAAPRRFDPYNPN
jgi:elongation factor P hydroxylase